MVTLRCGLGFIYPYNARAGRLAKGIGAITRRKKVTVPPGSSRVRLEGSVSETYGRQEGLA